MRFGSLRALGSTTFLLTIPIGMIATLLATRNPFESTEVFTEWIGIGVLSQLAMGALMLVAYRVCRQLSGSTRRISVICSAFLAGAVRGVTLAVLADQAGLVTTANIPVRTLSSAGIFGLWLLAIGATLHANDDYKAKLRDVLRELIATDVVTSSRASALNQAQTASIEARIDDHVRAIRSALDASTELGNPAASARVLRAGIDERIRPLSHELWHASRAQTRGVRTVGQFLTRAARTPPPLVGVATSLAIVFVVNSLIWNEPIPGLLVGITYAAAFVTILFVGYRGFSTVTPRRTIATLAGLLVLPALAVWIVSTVIGSNYPDASLAVMAVGGVVAVAFAIMGRTAIDDRERTLDALRSAITPSFLQAEIAAADQRKLSERTATHLHNTVQARLTAAALHLEHAAAVHDDSLANESLEQARSVLANVRLPGEHVQNPRERLEEIVTAWSGIADISIQAPESTSDVARWHLAVDAIDEAIANGIRHGGASNIQLTVVDESDALVIEVTDNGSEKYLSGNDGFGRQWLSAVTAGQWHQRQTETGTTLMLRIRGER